MSRMCDNDNLSASIANVTHSDNISNKTNKRRSLIFQRRSINHQLQNNIANEYLNEADIIDDKSEIAITSTDDDNFDLTAYILKLKNERDEWKKILNERKSLRRRLTKYELNIGDHCELDLTILNDDDRSFILSRPNYHEICNNINNLVPIAVKVATLNTHINHLNKNLIETIGEKIVESTKKITELAKK